MPDPTPQEERNSNPATADQATRVRQGLVTGRVRWILLLSLAAAIVAMAVVLGAV